MDFGLAARLKTEQNVKFVGNEVYKAPECEPGRPYGLKDDWYAFGQLLFHAHAKKRFLTDSGWFEWYIEHEGQASDEILMCNFLSEKGSEVIKNAIPSEAGDQLPALISMLILQQDKHLLNTQFHTWEEHPVLIHPYWTSTPNPISWIAIKEKWPDYEIGLCTSPVRVVPQTVVMQGVFTGLTKATQEDCNKLGDAARVPCYCRAGSSIEHCCCKNMNLLH